MKFLAKATAACIRLYQVTLSPLKRILLGPHAACRFYPTCSEYARVAMLRHGFFCGGWMGLKRLFRCHPFHPGGHDPVPQTCCQSSLVGEAAGNEETA